MQEPRGTRDFLPDEMFRRRALETRLRATVESFGYREVQTPTFEELELFTAKSGPAILDELYEFQDKGGRAIALRPELTASVMRLYFSKLKSAPKPVKVYYFSNCFRYDQPQAGRYREFWQLGCELIGEDAPVAHAELVALCVALLERAGITDFAVRLGHLDILRATLEEMGIPRDKQGPLMRLIDKKDQRGLQEALPKGVAYGKLSALFDIKTLDDLRKAKVSSRIAPAVEFLGKLMANLRDLGLNEGRVAIDATIARGLDYYSGLVFEIDAPKLGSQKQLLGGGVYDLSGVFGEKPVPSAGFALGFDRLLIALEAEGKSDPVASAIDVHAVALEAAALPNLLKVASLLRRAGARVEVEPEARAAKKALARSSQLGARFAILIGARELEKGEVAWKDLTSGEQVTIPAASAAAHWSQRTRA